MWPTRCGPYRGRGVFIEAGTSVVNLCFILGFFAGGHPPEYKAHERFEGGAQGGRRFGKQRAKLGVLRYSLLFVPTVVAGRK
jgi:hypothetical protein